jgi:hypothetical protein
MSETRVSRANVKVGANSESQGKAANSSEKQDRGAVQLCSYRVVSILKEDCEAWHADDTWYKYVVGNGKSTITGHRPGTREQVEEHAEWFVAELNARRGRGGSSVWSPRRRGRPAQKSTETGGN